MAPVLAFRHMSLTFCRTVSALTLITLSLSLGACEQNEKTRNLINQRADETQKSLDVARNATQAPQKSFNPLTVTDKIWVGDKAQRMQRGMPLPSVYEGSRGITLVSAEPMTLAEIATAIGNQTSIPIRISNITPPKATTKPGEVSNADTMQISYEGPLSGLLERVSANFGVNWRFDGSSVSITKFETRIFAIESLPGKQEVVDGMQDDTSSGSSGGGGSSGSSSSSSVTQSLTQNSKFSIDLKYWDEIGQVLNSMLAGNGTAVVSPSIGTVTVTTTPETMRTIADYITKENVRLSRQIAINVQIYSVNLTEGEDFNIAFTGFLQHLSKFSGLTYTSASAPASTSGFSALGNLNIAILNSAADNTVHAGDVFNALSAIGDTSTIAQFPMTTLNNRPISRRVGTDVGYVASISTALSTSTSTPTTSSITPGTIHQGFSLQVTPRLLDDGRILIQYSLSIIGQPNIQTFGNASTGQVGVPTTPTQVFVQQSVLRSGSTLVIGGVDQENSASSTQGVGDPYNYLLGGGTSSKIQRQMLFMAISPQVMDVHGAEQN